MVHAHLRPRAAGPELGQPGGPRRLPEDPALLVRPRRGRVPRGRGPCPDEGHERAAAVQGGARPRGRQQPREAPLLGPRRGARGVRRVAHRVQRVHAAAHRGGRGVGARRPPCPLRQPRRARPGVQLRPPQGRLEPPPVPRDHHEEPRRGHVLRRVVHVGLLQPRRRPACHALRPAAHAAPGARTARTARRGS